MKRDGYERERLILRKYEVLAFIDAAQAEKWLQDHLSIPKMRRIAVDKLMARQQWAQAERLLVQGLEKALAGHQQGMANEWRALLLEVAQGHDALVTVEEGALMGGAGSAVLEALQAHGVQRPVLCLGLPDVFIEHGDPAHLLALQGLDAEGITRAVRARFPL